MFAWAVLVLLATVTLFLGSGQIPLFDTDEPRYAQAAREMMERGDWVLPTFNGQPRYAKPVFFYWLLISAYRLFGVNEFAARFWSGVAGFAIAALLFFALRKPFGWETAAFTSLCWLTAFGAQLFAHAAITDMVLTAFMTAAILAAWQGLLSQQVWWFLVATVAAAGAVLTKGPVGLVLPLTIIGVAALSVRPPLLFQWQRKEALVLAGCSVIFLALVLPWYLAVNERTGGEFLRQFLLVENVQRYAQSGKMPFWLHAVYFPVTAFLLAFPWSALGIWMLGRTQTKGRGKGEGGRELTEQQQMWHWLLRWWAVVPVLLFTFSRTKNPQYVLLSAPALCALAALWATNASTEQERRGKGLWAVTMAFAAALVPVTPAFVNRFPDWRMRLTGGAPIELGWSVFAIGAISLAAVLFIFVSRRQLILMGSATMVAIYLLLGPVVAQLGRYRQEPFKHFAQMASAQLSSADQLVVYRRDLSGVVFYSNRRVKRVDDAKELAQMLRQPHRVDVLTHVKVLPELKRVKGWHLVERQGAFLWLSNRPVACPEHSP